MSASSSSFAQSTTVYAVLITVIENFVFEPEEGDQADRANGQPQAPECFKVYFSLHEANEAAKIALNDYLGEDEPEEEENLTKDGCYVPSACLPKGISMKVRRGGGISIFCVPDDGWTAYEVNVVKSELVQNDKILGDAGKVSLGLFP